MSTHAQSGVDLAEIAQIELFILKRMKEFAAGDHASVFKGSGFNFAGMRDWEPGDAVSSIDWAQSSLTNFSPLITREFEQNSTASITAVVDASLSTRCGARGVGIDTAIARAVAAVGLSGVLFQDQFGLISFDEKFRRRLSVRPRIGKPHVVHCLDLYARGGSDVDDAAPGELTAAIAGQLRRTSLVPVISDFLFADAPRFIEDLGRLNAAHDVFLLLVDVRFAFAMPDSSAGWLEVHDIETGRTRVLSRQEVRRLAARVESWQHELMRRARAAGLDLVRVGLDRWEMENTLVEFVAERRLRKVKAA